MSGVGAALLSVMLLVAPTMCHVRWGNKHPGLVVHRALTFTLLGPQGWTPYIPGVQRRETPLLSAQVGEGSEDTREFGSRTAQKEGQQALQTGRERLLEERTSGLQPEGGREQRRQREAITTDEPETEPDHMGWESIKLVFPMATTPTMS